jgi:hypothetical protein
MAASGSRLHRRVIPTVLVLGLVAGRWPWATLLLAAGAWPALLVATGVIVDLGDVPFAAALAVANAAVGVAVNRGVASLGRLVVAGGR